MSHRHIGSMYLTWMCSGHHDNDYNFTSCGDVGGLIEAWRHRNGLLFIFRVTFRLGFFVLSDFVDKLRVRSGLQIKSSNP